MVSFQGFGHHGAQQLNNYGSFGGGQGHHGVSGGHAGLPYGGYGAGAGIGSPYLYSGGIPYSG